LVYEKTYDLSRFCREKEDRVKEAVVLAKEDKADDKYLCTYVVTDDEIPSVEMLQSLSENLPNYMVP